MARLVRTGRLEAFSDGVFAIAVTLLVLELSVPADAGDDLLGALVDQWPSYLAYVVSFATIGAVWLAHASATEHLERADTVLVRLNLLLLLLVSLLPFPTGLAAEHIGADDPGRVATTVLGVNLWLVAVVVSAMWRHGLRRGLVRLDPGGREARVLTRRLTPGIAGYVGAVLLGLVLPRVAMVGYLVIAVALLVPVRPGRDEVGGAAPSDGGRSPT